MSRVSRVIAPMLRAAGLDIDEVGRADGQIHELVVTNPLYPTWGRVVIDREGHGRTASSPAQGESDRPHP